MPVPQRLRRLALASAPIAALASGCGERGDLAPSDGPLGAAALDLVSLQEAKVVAADGAAFDDFGTTVAISGDTAVIGANRDDDGGSNAGSAYVFVRAGNAWIQEAKLHASDPATEDRFGAAVAVSGDTAVIGAYGNDDSGLESGSAYVFVRSGGVWTQQAKLVPADGATDDFFGVSVAASGDTVIVGAYRDDEGGPLNNGSAYVFVRSGGAWTQQAKLVAPDGTTGDFLGYSVAVDGDTAVVGAYGANDNGPNCGAAYVFTRAGTTWTQETKLLASDGGLYEYFGYSVAVSGDTALIGAYQTSDNGPSSGSAYVFERSAGVWAEQAKLLASDGAADDFFGNSVALAGDAALVGSFYSDPGASEQGAAYLFERGASGWTEQQKVLSADGAALDYFGISVALSGDTALVGAYADDDKGTESGSAYLFVLKKGLGEACAAASDCGSGFCADGVCCSSACDVGACDVCSVAAGAASDGTCETLVTGACAPVCVTVQDTTLGANLVQDAQIVTSPTDPVRASTNFGLVQQMNAGYVGTDVRRVVMRFDLAGAAVPPGALITSASLTFRMVQSLGKAPLDFYAGTAVWSELGVTWNQLASAPNGGLGAFLGSVPTLGVPNNSNITFALSPTLVQTWLTASTSYGLVIDHPAAGRTVIGSSEAPTLGPRPKLDVCYAN